MDAFDNAQRKQAKKHDNLEQLLAKDIALTQKTMREQQNFQERFNDAVKVLSTNLATEYMPPLSAAKRAGMLDLKRLNLR